jgi:hypothetical protein
LIRKYSVATRAAAKTLQASSFQTNINYLSKHPVFWIKLRLMGIICSRHSACPFAGRLRVTLVFQKLPLAGY